MQDKIKKQLTKRELWFVDVLEQAGLSEDEILSKLTTFNWWNAQDIDTEKLKDLFLFNKRLPVNKSPDDYMTLGFNEYRTLVEQSIKCLKD